MYKANLLNIELHPTFTVFYFNGSNKVILNTDEPEEMLTASEDDMMTVYRGMTG